MEFPWRSSLAVCLLKNCRNGSTESDRSGLPLHFLSVSSKMQIYIYTFQPARFIEVFSRISLKKTQTSPLNAHENFRQKAVSDNWLINVFLETLRCTFSKWKVRQTCRRPRTAQTHTLLWLQLLRVSETGSLSHGGSVCMELGFFFMNGKSENKEWRWPVCVCGVVSVSSPENDGSVTASVSEDNAGSDAEENLETKVER